MTVRGAARIVVSGGDGGRSAWRAMREEHGANPARRGAAHPRAGMAARSPQPFYFDLGDPRAYVAAERLIASDPSREWVPARSDVALRCAPEGDALREDVSREVEALGLQPLRWPDPFPFDSELALLAATYAKSIGRVVAFALAAFRQAFAGGHALDEDHVLIAASACEMHPRAVLKALESERVRAQLDTFTEAAQ